MGTTAPDPARSSEAAGARSAGKRLRVVVLSPLRFFAEALASELSRHPHLCGVAPADAETDAGPDVLLVEPQGPPGIELLERWRERFPQASVIVLGALERPEEVLACVRAGAVGYVPRDAVVTDLVSEIERVSRGEPHSPWSGIGPLSRRTVGTMAEAAAAAALTPREREVAAMLSRGLSNKAIARALSVGVPTVKTHVHNVLRKLGARSRLTLVAATRRHASSAKRAAQPDQP